MLLRAKIKEKKKSLDFNRKAKSLDCEILVTVAYIYYEVNLCVTQTHYPEGHTGNSRYVDFMYLDTITYVEVIFHSQHFFSMYLCISTPSMSKTINMKQRVSRGDFSCPRRNFYYICYFLCRSQKSALTWVPYCLFRLCTCMT